jgi:hypothetical protein
MTAAAQDDISIYDRMVRPATEVAHLLATGKRRHELMAYFGAADYQMLCDLAQKATAAEQDPDRLVYIIPGILGSQLCLPRERPAPDNLLWLDPYDVHLGLLTQLALSRSPVRACGPVLHGYLPLKLTLEAAGYTVHGFDYDWRRDIAATATALALRLATESAREISLIAHSMGGLVARIALHAESGQRVQRLITLGTPHGGSFAPVLAVRGVYPVLRRLAQIDPFHSAEDIAREVFASFHSLYQMLPQNHSPDLIDARNWPRSGPQPNATLLARVPMLDLGGTDARISAIAGHGFDSVVSVANVDDGFYYRFDGNGDGTVPTDRATLEGCEAWYCNVTHNELLRSPVVHDAVLQLLADCAPRLPGAPPPSKLPVHAASDSELREHLRDKIDWSQLDRAQRSAYLDSLK